MKIQKEIDFILAVDALKNVQRRNYNADDSRRENTAEHSWQIIILAQILFPYAKNRADIDLLRVIRMLSVHDLVEIEAGDTFLFDEAAMIGKFEREKLSAQNIFGILNEPIRSEFFNLWLEFEEEQTPDAIFTCAIDRIMPFILNSHTSGKSWTEAAVTEKQVRSMLENAITRASDEMGEAFQYLMIKNLETEKVLK
ncbi:HD domain-containing protein [Chryseobacterium aquaticum]|uniref:HD domain-containing protein n=1 Tax=Chryseobacterium aquaticum TaxID=452084 RepID=A0A848N2D1_9FLAO|nr:MULTISPECIES: HD domain-containing protein [Chryseobacterium]NMR34516.1 HD domain-containing protein [Chryseobacterium aquaticum]NRQ46499.1 HD domain-containing protein [Chryseobacterium sp. C-204]